MSFQVRHRPVKFFLRVRHCHFRLSIGPESRALFSISARSRSFDPPSCRSDTDSILIPRRSEVAAACAPSTPSPPPSGSSTFPGPSFLSFSGCKDSELFVCSEVFCEFTPPLSTASSCSVCCNSSVAASAGASPSTSLNISSRLLRENISPLPARGIRSTFIILAHEVFQIRYKFAVTTIKGFRVLGVNVSFLRGVEEFGNGYGSPSSRLSLALAFHLAIDSSLVNRRCGGRFAISSAFFFRAEAANSRQPPVDVVEDFVCSSIV